MLPSSCISGFILGICECGGGGGGDPSGAPAIESVRGGLTPSHQENCSGGGGEGDNHEVKFIEATPGLRHHQYSLSSLHAE